MKAGKCPSDLKKERTWRTRPDPFELVWPEIKAKLDDAPELEAQILFEDLMERNPGAFEPGQLRTFQRRVKSWRAQKGPVKEVFFPQMHRAGEAAQTDFTWANELNVTIAGKVFEHMLCHFVLPYSNWQWATICHSESMSSLKHGIQESVFQLGGVPRYHQTDHSTAAPAPALRLGYVHELHANCPRDAKTGHSLLHGDAYYTLNRLPKE